MGDYTQIIRKGSFLMAFTKKEHEDLLREIALSGGDTPKMLELMQKLRDDFDDREGELKRYRETADRKPPEGEQREEKEVREESREDNKEDGGERRQAYDALDEDTKERRMEGVDRESRSRGVDRDTVSRADYEDLKRKYIERFFSTPEEAIKENKEDVKKDDRVKDLSFEDLFKDREG